jgi:hypothetical protein
MSRRYPHRLKATRPGTVKGTQDPESGAWVPGGPAVVVYEDRCDFQAAGSFVARGGDLGARGDVADGVVMLERKKAAYLFNPGDRLAITLDDPARTTLHGECGERDELSNAVTVRLLTPEPTQGGE